MIRSVEDYQQIMKNGLISEGSTFYLNDPRSVENLITAVKGKYSTRILEQREVPFWANDLIAIKISKLETGVTQ